MKKYTYILSIVGLLVSQIAIAQKTDVIKIKGRFDRAWVMDPASDRIFATNANPDEDGGVDEFDPKTGDTINLHKAIKGGNSLATKNGKMFIAYTKSRRNYVAVFDLEKNKLTKKQIYYASRPITLLTNRHTKWVYALSDGRRVNQLNPETDRTDKSHYLQNGKLYRGCLANDGTTFLGGSLGANWEPKLFRLHQPYPNNTHTEYRVEDTKVQSTSATTVNSLYFRNYWAIGNQVWNSELTEKLSEFPGQIIVDHPTHDLAVSYDRQHIFISQFSSGKLLEKIQIADEKPKRGWSKQPMVSFSSKNEFLFVGDEKNGYIVPIEKFLKRAGIRVNIVGPTSVRAGFSNPLEIPLSTGTNAANVGEVKIKLERGPQGASLRGNKIVWSPSRKDIGQHEFVVSASNGSKTDSLTIKCEIISAPLKLGLNKRMWKLSNDQRYAVIVGGALVDPSRRFGAEKQDHIQIVDLNEQKSLAVKKITKNISNFFVIGDYVFANVRQNQYLYRYSIKDLDAEPRRVLLQGYVQSLDLQPDGKLLVRLGDQHYTRGVQVLDYETFKIVKDDRRSKPARQQAYNTVKPRFGFEKGVWSDSSLVFDRNNKIISTIGPVFNQLRYTESNPNTNYRRRNLPVLHPRMQKHLSSMPSHSFGSAQRSEILWSRLLNRNLYDTRGSKILDFNGYAALHPDYPMAMRIRFEVKRVNSGRQNIKRIYLDAYELVEGEKILNDVVHEQTTSQYGSSHFGTSGSHGDSPFHILGKTVVIFDRDQLHFATIPEKAIQRVRNPLMLQFPTRHQIDLSQKSEFKIPCNQSKDLTFEIDQVYEGVTVDETNGVLKIDGPKLLAKTMEQRGRYFRETDEIKVLQKKLSIPEDRVVFSMPLTIRVNDDTGQFDSLRYSLLATIDRKKFGTLMAKRQERELAQHRKMVQQRLEQMQKQLKALAAEAESAKKDVGQGSVEKRVENLEKRIEALQAKMRYYVEQIRAKLEPPNVDQSPIEDRK